jgi:DNA polymerase-3 subunit gamma/tau
MLVLLISSAPLARLLGESSNVNLLRSALEEVLGVNWQISTTTDAEAPAAARPVSDAPVSGRSDAPPSGRSQPPRGPAAPSNPAPPSPTGQAQAPRESHSVAASVDDAGSDDEPPEPDPRDDPGGPGEIAAAAAPAAPRPSSEDVAISLLQSSLGARALETGQ